MINQNAASPSEASFSQPKSLIDLSFTPFMDDSDAMDVERDLVLSHREAQAGSPSDFAACGEEDPGSGLEFLVTRDEQ